MTKRVNQLMNYLMEGKISEKDFVNIIKEDLVKQAKKK